MTKKGTRRRRNRPPRRVSPRIIVVGEGRETEYNYFTTFAQRFKDVGPAVIPRRPRKTGSPLTIVEQAIQFLDEDPYFEPKQGDRCYCLLDVEPHDGSKAASLDDAFARAKDNGIRILLSNPSFEFWLLCHADDEGVLKQRLAQPKDVDAALKQTFGVGKNELNANPRRFARLVEDAESATALARQVHSQYHGGSSLRQANPGTEVYLLAEYFLGLASSPP